MLVVIPRIASRSMGDALSRSPPGVVGISSVFVRHPWDRLVSALYSVLQSEMPLDDRIQQYIDAAAKAGCDLDSHLRPQSSFFKTKMDFIGRYENLAEDWKCLQTLCPGLADLPPKPASHRPRWEEAKIDWARWYPLYEQDFMLWHSVTSS